AAANKDSETGQKLLNAERFGQVVVGSRLKTAYALRQRRPCAEDEDGGGVSALAGGLQELEAVPVREHQIENDGIGLGLTPVFRSFGKRSPARGVSAGLSERLRDEVREARLILDDQ